MLMIRRAASIAFLCLALSGCGDGPDRGAAGNCIRSAIENDLKRMQGFADLFGKSNFAPTVTLRDLSFGECQKDAPGRHLCLVEYRIEMTGGDPGLMGFVKLGEALSGTDLRQLQHTYWRFTETSDAIACQHVE